MITLTDATTPSGGTASVTNQVAYSYSGDNLRASATTGGGSSTSTTENYTWDVLAAVPHLLNDNTLFYIYGVGAAPLAQLSAGAPAAVTYLHADATGNVRTTTNSAGTVTSTADYDPHGTPTQNSTSGAVTRFGYAGEYTDPTGYNYLRNRYYDPTTAQFLSRDPFEDRTRTAYGYTGGNPLQHTDPLGLDWVENWFYDTNGENVIVNALESYGIGAANATITAVPNLLAFTVNYTPIGIAARMVGWSGVPYMTGPFQDPNACNDIYSWSSGIGELAGPQLVAAGGLGSSATAVTSDAGRFAPTAARSATTDLFRAVGAREFDNVMRTRRFEPAFNSLEGRQFATTFDEALAYANRDVSKVAILRATVDESVLPRLDFSRSIDPFIFRNGVYTVQPGSQSAAFHAAMRGVEHVL